MLSTQIVGVILGGFIALYFLAIAIFIGLFAAEIVQEIAGEEADVWQYAGQGLFYLIFADMAMRMVAQSAPRVDLRPLFVLPISKRSLLRHQNAKLLYERTHLLWVALFTAFVFRTEGEGKWAWWLLAMSIPLTNAYLISIWKWLVTKSTGKGYAFLAALYLPLGLEFLLDRKLSMAVSDFALWTQSDLWPFALAFIPLVILLALHMKVIVATSYESPKGSSGGASGQLDFLNRYGITGQLLNLRLAQIWRNKRLKRVMILSPVLLIMGVAIFDESTGLTEVYPMYVWAVLLTGYGAIQLGQWAFPMDGGEYAFWMTYGSTHDYVKNKALFLRLTVVLFTVLCTPYFFFGWNVALHLTSAALYNLGITVPVALWLSSRIKTKLETNQGGAFNMQGADSATFLSLIPLLGLPIGFHLLPYGIYIAGGLGLVGLIASDSILKKLGEYMARRKYTLLSLYAKKN